LDGYGVSVLHSGVADVVRAAAGGAGELARDPFSVRGSLADLQEHVRPSARRREAEVFFDDEVFGLGTQAAAAERHTERTGRRKRTVDPRIEG
jgi:hypothetical protein